MPGHIYASQLNHNSQDLYVCSPRRRLHAIEPVLVSCCCALNFVGSSATGNALIVKIGDICLNIALAQKESFEKYRKYR